MLLLTAYRNSLLLYPKVQSPTPKNCRLATIHALQTTDDTSLLVPKGAFSLRVKRAKRRDHLS